MNVTSEMVERLKDAIEGECEGLAIDNAQAKAILEYLGVAALASPVGQAEGWNLVPVEPTEVMIEAGVSAEWGGTLGSRVDLCYRAMISAALPSVHGDAP